MEEGLRGFVVQGRAPRVAQALYDLDIEKLGDVTMQNSLFFTARNYSVTNDDDMKSFWTLGFPAPSYFYRSIFAYTLRKKYARLPKQRTRYFLNLQCHFNF